MDLTNVFNMTLQLLKKYTSNFFISNTKKYHFNPHHYKNREVALLTQHGKEKVLAPILYESIGCMVTRVDNYDTDILGTFTRDIPRLNTQVDTVRKKALIGMKHSSLSLGLASEGSFGPDPFTGMFSRNVEILIWVDNDSNLEIIAMAQGRTNLDHLLTSSWSEVEVFAKKIGFPEHYLIVRPESENDKRIIKNISTWDELQRAFNLALEQSTNKQLFIETDMRAHANPTRMNNIEVAAQELVKKLSSLCPNCNAPGYWIVEHISGLPCRACNIPTHEIRAEVHACSKCKHQVIIERKDQEYANPSHCEYCNP